MATQSYLTPTRYLAGGYGNGGNLTRAALRNVLVRATSTVNAYCNAPSQPQRYDFRGGTVTDEQHQWPYVAPLLMREGSRRIYLYQRPVRTVTSLNVQLAKQYSIELDTATNLVVNTMEGYLEVVAISPTIVGNYFPVGWNFGLWVPIANVSYTYGWEFEVTGDVLEAEGTREYSASHGNWSDDPVTIYVDGVEVDAADYSVNTDDGSVTFEAAAEPDVQSEVTADYTYLLPDNISQATGIIASALIGSARLAERGMIGLQSLRVAEVSITQMNPASMVSKNGITIPHDAANLLGPFVIRSAA